MSKATESFVQIHTVFTLLLKKGNKTHCKQSENNGKNNKTRKSRNVVLSNDWAPYTVFSFFMCEFLCICVLGESDCVSTAFEVKSLNNRKITSNMSR